ncbi:effector-associated domain 2-containing protein [Actinophytocola sp.]|uniref:effector-associated domain 2-containing protein n=1 Tax=Actinophytocola sp. TaxID=1872138 RepID=UPI00389B013C
MYESFRRAFAAVGIQWEQCFTQDGGDSILALVPGDVPKEAIAGDLPNALLAALCAHNQLRPPDDQLKLRMTLHAGEVTYDDHGVSSTAIIEASRLLDAPPLKEALAESSASLAVIASEYFFSEVIWHDPGYEPDAYRKVAVRVKQFSGFGWIRLPGHELPPVEPPNGTPVGPAEGTPLGPANGRPVGSADETPVAPPNGTPTGRANGTSAGWANGSSIETSNGSFTGTPNGSPAGASNEPLERLPVDAPVTQRETPLVVSRERPMFIVPPLRPASPEFYEFVNALESIPCMRNEDTRAQVVDQLRFAGMVRYFPSRRAHITSILRTCTDFENGVLELVNVIVNQETNDSVPLHDSVSLKRLLPLVTVDGL